MENVKDLLCEIREGLTQKVSASQKDEVRVMKAMLNDRDYRVGVYSNSGLEGEICPSKEAREMIASAISGAAKIPQAEAEKLAEDYDFKKSEAINMINISKEFVNTYLETGRKLPLGGREKSNVSLIKKDIPNKTTTYPKKVGVDESGKPLYKTETTEIKAHSTVKASGSCPTG